MIVASRCVDFWTLEFLGRNFLPSKTPKKKVASHFLAIWSTFFQHSRLLVPPLHLPCFRHTRQHQCRRALPRRSSLHRLICVLTRSSRCQAIAACSRWPPTRSTSMSRNRHKQPHPLLRRSNPTQHMQIRTKMRRSKTRQTLRPARRIPDVERAACTPSVRTSRRAVKSDAAR